MLAEWQEGDESKRDDLRSLLAFLVKVRRVGGSLGLQGRAV